MPGFLKLTEGSTLNLTCEVRLSLNYCLTGPGLTVLCQAAGWGRGRDEARDEVRLSWYLPNNFVQPQPR